MPLDISLFPGVPNHLPFPMGSSPIQVSNKLITIQVLYWGIPSSKSELVNSAERWASRRPGLGKSGYNVGTTVVVGHGFAWSCKGKPAGKKSPQRNTHTYTSILVNNQGRYLGHACMKPANFGGCLCLSYMWCFSTQRL